MHRKAPNKNELPPVVPSGKRGFKGQTSSARGSQVLPSVLQITILRLPTPCQRGAVPRVGSRNSPRCRLRRNWTADTARNSSLISEKPHRNRSSLWNRLPLRFLHSTTPV